MSPKAWRPTHIVLLVILLTGALPHPTWAEDAPEFRPPQYPQPGEPTQAYAIPQQPPPPRQSHLMRKNGPNGAPSSSPGLPQSRHAGIGLPRENRTQPINTNGVVSEDHANALKSDAMGPSSVYAELDEFPEPQINPTATAVPAELLERENQSIGNGSNRPNRSTRTAFSSERAGKNWWFEGIMSLAAVLMFVVILAYAVRRWLPAARQLDRAGLEVLGKTHLSPKQSIAVVKIGRRLVMIGITPDRITSLATVDEPAEVAAMLADFSGPGKTGPRNRFGAWMDRAQADFTKLDDPMTRGMDQAPAGYGRTRHQVRGLLGKVKAMTAAGAVKVPTPKT